MNVILQSISPTIVYPKWYLFWRKPIATLMIDTFTEQICKKGDHYRTQFGILEVYYSYQISKEFDADEKYRTFFSPIEKQIVRKLDYKFMATLI